MIKTIKFAEQKHKTMKKLILIILAVFTWAATSEAQVQKNEKLPDVSEFLISSRAFSENGTLSVGDPTFNRFLWGGAYLNVGDNCDNDGAILSGVGTAVFYHVYEIFSPAGEDLVATVESDDFDTYLMLYCDPFDPNNPLDNAIFADDDGGTGFNSAFLPGDNIALTQNVTYYLVVSSFSNNAEGDYTLTVDGSVLLTSLQIGDVVDICMFPAGAGKADVKMRPQFPILDNYTVSEIRYTVRWNDPTLQVTSIDIIPPFSILPDGPVYTPGDGFYYQNYITIAGAVIGFPIDPYEEVIIASFNYTGVNGAQLEIINNEFTANNNLDYYIEVNGEERTGTIYCSFDTVPVSNWAILVVLALISIFTIVVIRRVF